METALMVICYAILLHHPVRGGGHATIQPSNKRPPSPPPLCQNKEWITEQWKEEATTSLLNYQHVVCKQVLKYSEAQNLLLEVVWISPCSWRKTRCGICATSRREICTREQMQALTLITVRSICHLMHDSFEGQETVNLWRERNKIKKNGVPPCQNAFYERV